MTPGANPSAPSLSQGPPPSLPSSTALRLSRRGAEQWRAGAPWLDREELQGPTPDGDVVRIEDARGQPLGTGLYSLSGRVALRRWSSGDEALDSGTLRARLQRALLRRKLLLAGQPGLQEIDAFRLVHGEADELPGLFVDVYGVPLREALAPRPRQGGAAVLQTAVAAMDAREGLIGAALRDLLGVTQVVVRDDGSARDIEGLPRRRGLLHDPAAPGAEVTSLLQRFHDAGSSVEADLLQDGKTGSFLDQQANHGAAHAYAAALLAGEGAQLALDAFTYHGGFALGLARAGLQVEALDESAAAIARARKNAQLSGVVVDFRVENAFTALRGLEAAGRRYQVVVVDPPALAKRGRAGAGAAGREAMAAALRAYKELNLRALRLLRPGGLLFTCSCSGRLSPQDFGGMLREAAADARREVQLLERRGAGLDHPVLLGLSETEYLKCWVLKALG